MARAAAIFQRASGSYALSWARASVLVAAILGLPRAAFAYSLFPTESSLGVDAIGYLHTFDDGPKAYQSSLFPEVVGHLQEKTQGAWWGAAIQADGLVVFDSLNQGNPGASIYAELPEAYVGTSLKAFPLQAIAGRKLEHWSHLDEQWNLGIWQPRFRWDYLHPEQVGLTGVFLRVEQPMVQIVGLFAPIGVPERGVNVSNANGTLTSNSRYFGPPPASVDPFGQNQGTPLNYSLMMPPLGDLILHPGGSLMARVGRDQGAWGSVGAAYLPINQALLAEMGELQLSNDPNAIHGNVYVIPRIVYHGMLSAEAGYQAEGAGGWISFLGEQPFMDKTPDTWTTQQLTSSSAISATAELRVAGPAKRSTWLTLSGLRQWGGNAPDVGPDAVAGTSVFEARYPFHTAFSLGVRTEAVSRVFATSNLIYDMGHQGEIWSTEVRYRPTARWLFAAGADFLFSQQHSDPEDSDLIGRFSANDRIHAGVSYVF